MIPNMPKLTYKKRKDLKDKDFALPAKRHAGRGGYPIENAAHARNALARISEYGTPREIAIVRAKVHKKYPKILEADMKKKKR